MKYITLQLGEKQKRVKEDHEDLGISVVHGEIRVRFGWQNERA